MEINIVNDNLPRFHLLDDDSGTEGIAKRA